MLQRIINFIKKLLSENGEISTTRFIIVISMMAFFLPFCWDYAILSYHNMKLQDVPQSVIELLGVLGAWKIGQKVTENKGE
jgi:hypothetical protein